MLLPASVIHLAMRFPVVAPRFRSPAVVAVPYVFWLFPAAFAQLHLDDAAFLNSLERIAIGATFVAAGDSRRSASLTSLRAMTPIERARTRALLLGLGLGSAVPFVYFVSGGTPPAGSAHRSSSRCWPFRPRSPGPIVRYRLLDPPMWVQSAVPDRPHGGRLTAAGEWPGVSLRSRFLGEPAAIVSAEVIPVALTTTVLYQLLHLGLRRGAGRPGAPRASLRAVPRGGEPRSRGGATA